MNAQQKIGHRLGVALTALGLSNAEAGSLLGESEFSVGQWIDGLCAPSTKAMLGLATQHRIGWDYLFMGVTRGLPVAIRHEVEAALQERALPEDSALMDLELDDAEA